MAKRTLLELTQDILSEMDSDEVNSIGDTVEATQVASVIRNTYNQYVEEWELQPTETVFQLDASGTTARPTHMTVPDGIFDIVEVRYDKRASASGPSAYATIPYAFPGEFLDLVSNRNSSSSEYTAVTDPSGVAIVVANNGGPNYWTSFDGGSTIVFDSYDSSLESTLQQSKTQCVGRKKVTISLSDTAVLDLPETLEQLVYTNARELCFDIYKDGAPRSVVEQARRSRNLAKRRKRTVATPAIARLPDYGRK